MTWWKRYVAGAAGGAAGTAAMSLYMKGMRSLKKDGHNPQDGPKQQEHDVSLIGRQHQEGEPATAAIGRLMYRKVTGREPDQAMRGKLSNLVHWGYGVDMGATYGLLRDRKRKLDIVGGLAFGAGLWLLGDEVAVPLLGLAEGPKAYPKRLHAETLGAHLVYGAVTAVATQALERAL